MEGADAVMERKNMKTNWRMVAWWIPIAMMVQTATAALSIAVWTKWHSVAMSAVQVVAMVLVSLAMQRRMFARPVDAYFEPGKEYTDSDMESIMKSAGLVKCDKCGAFGVKKS